MTARVLVVDDIAANVKLLDARLSAEYFDVITAMNAQEQSRDPSYPGGDGDGARPAV
jgi:CheY-like chemotaxis protein